MDARMVLQHLNQERPVSMVPVASPDDSIQGESLQRPDLS